MFLSRLLAFGTSYVSIFLEYLEGGDCMSDCVDRFEDKQNKRSINRWMKSIEKGGRGYLISVCIFVVSTVIFAIIALNSKREQRINVFSNQCLIRSMLCAMFLGGIKRAYIAPPLVSLLRNPIKRIFHYIGKPKWYLNFCWCGFYFSFCSFMFSIILAIMDVI